ncbi:AP-1-like transcription factor [Emydomyces testavorans]|uniref:AP-1-like transcription factor n=1 Tax=Emydomyces testavorans TaxID=2070801 RepID=A0AAF0DKP7_9EURO|nr:AP-1-like transcription factor [Emydomyces testavorans]
MDYSFYSSTHPHQAYQFYGLPNAQHPQPDAASADQFQEVPPVPAPFEAFQPYNFDPVAHDHHPPDVLPPESFPADLLEPTSRDSSDNRLTDSSVVHQSTATENSDELTADAAQNNRSSSEEKDSLTPAQSRRKAQNRAAQRAFRERKERRVRDLEQELNEYKQNVNHLLEDNECLKREIAKVATENEILRATSTANRCPGADGHHDPQPITTGPMKYSPTEYAAPESENKPKPVHRIKVHEATGDKLLDASATWDLIVSRLADEEVKVDVQDIYNRLKGHAICDGTGPVLEETRVKKAIEESIAAGRDELL